MRASDKSMSRFFKESTILQEGHDTRVESAAKYQEEQPLDSRRLLQVYPFKQHQTSNNPPSDGPTQPADFLLKDARLSHYSEEDSFLRDQDGADIEDDDGFFTQEENREEFKDEV